MIVYQVGDEVEKADGDYTFKGVVVTVFQKLNGTYRYVVEDDRGILHIFSFKNLARIDCGEIKVGGTI